MGLMPDLTSALQSFAQVFASGTLDIQKGTIDPEIFVHIDQPNGELRLTYGTSEGKKVTAMVVFIKAEPVKNKPCFAVGWAVPEEIQNQGRATKAFISAVAELRQGLARNGIKTFYVEAVIDKDNLASQRVAEKVVSATGKPGMDSHANVPIMSYFRLITADTVL